MTVYNIQTGSSVFLGFDNTADGVGAVERGRYVQQPEGNAALDGIAASVEVSAR